MRNDRSSDDWEVSLAKQVVESSTGRDFYRVGRHKDVDLRASSQPTIGVEVKRITSQVWRHTHARLTDYSWLHWSRNLRRHWSLFMPQPHTWPDTGSPPDVKKIHESIEPYLTTLEGLKVSDTGSALLVQVPGRDPMESSRFMYRLISETNDLLGPGGRASSHEPTDLLPPGWSLNIWKGGWPTMEAHLLAAQVSDMLGSEQSVPNKLRQQLARAPDDFRWAFLVFDSLLNLGQSMHHVGQDLRTTSLTLPREVDRVWLTLPSVMTIFFDRSTGWHDATGSMPKTYISGVGAD